MDQQNAGPSPSGLVMSAHFYGQQPAGFNGQAAMFAHQPAAQWRGGNPLAAMQQQANNPLCYPTGMMNVNQQPQIPGVFTNHQQVVAQHQFMMSQHEQQQATYAAHYNQQLQMSYPPPYPQRPPMYPPGTMQVPANGVPASTAVFQRRTTIQQHVTTMGGPGASRTVIQQQQFGHVLPQQPQLQQFVQVPQLQQQQASGTPWNNPAEFLRQMEHSNRQQQAAICQQIVNQPPVERPQQSPTRPPIVELPASPPANSNEEQREDSGVYSRDGTVEQPDELQAAVPTGQPSALSPPNDPQGSPGVRTLSSSWLAGSMGALQQPADGAAPSTGEQQGDAGVQPSAAQNLQQMIQEVFAGLVQQAPVQIAAEEPPTAESAPREQTPDDPLRTVAHLFPAVHPKRRVQPAILRPTPAVQQPPQPSPRPQSRPAVSPLALLLQQPPISIQQQPSPHMLPGTIVMFECPKCAEKFQKLDRLEDHYAHRHRTFECQVCYSRFETMIRRNNHEAQMHGFNRPDEFRQRKLRNSQLQLVGLQIDEHQMRQVEERVRVEQRDELHKQIRKFYSSPMRVQQAMPFGCPSAPQATMPTLATSAPVQQPSPQMLQELQRRLMASAAPQASTSPAMPALTPPMTAGMPPSADAMPALTREGALSASAVHENGTAAAPAAFVESSPRHRSTPSIFFSPPQSHRVPEFPTPVPQPEAADANVLAPQAAPKPPAEMIRCPTCARSYAGIKELEAHHQRRHAHRPFQCSRCFKSYKTYDKRNIHEQQEHAFIRDELHFQLEAAVPETARNRHMFQPPVCPPPNDDEPPAKRHKSQADEAAAGVTQHEEEEAESKPLIAAPPAPPAGLEQHEETKEKWIAMNGGPGRSIDVPEVITLDSDDEDEHFETETQLALAASLEKTTPPHVDAPPAVPPALDVASSSDESVQLLAPPDALEFERELENYARRETGDANPAEVNSNPPPTEQADGTPAVEPPADERSWERRVAEKPLRTYECAEPFDVVECLQLMQKNPEVVYYDLTSRKAHCAGLPASLFRRSPACRFLFVRAAALEDLAALRLTVEWNAVSMPRYEIPRTFNRGAQLFWCVKPDVPHSLQQQLRSTLSFKELIRDVLPSLRAKSALVIPSPEDRASLDQLQLPENFGIV
ncbi:hypothetical protein M3Y99_00381800 [Aphelenchoides fujianensis]|nr:hypothetical protein M3Y99_00381800 [Aphelenchoides fujianensis]